MQRDIRHSWHFNHPPDLVWEYLTKSELLAHWLMENDFKLIVGHKFQFRTKPKLNLGFDGNVYCEVLEIIPFKKLSYSWRGGLSKDNPTLDSVVTWTLTKTDTGTELVLEHKGFKGMKNLVTYIIMNLGWLKIGNRILKRINASKHETTKA
jgi:uncharacterized protein YndB with AHSA1/START domain